MTPFDQWMTAISTSATDLATLQRFKACGVDAIELSVGWQHCDEIDWPGLRRHADEAGICLWSYHLPFSGELNIASPDEAVRAAAVARQCCLMDRAAAIGIDKFIIHPSAEPIPDEERAAWMAAALRSLPELAEHAAALNAVICVEDLPRSCLGHTVDEMLVLCASDARLRVCFDVNHLLDCFGSTHREFVEKLGHLIVTTHMSDYDFVDEKHYFPGNGLIDWCEVTTLLEEAGYTGPFLYEGGFAPSAWNPSVPYATYEDAHERHLHIKEFRGRNA